MIAGASAAGRNFPAGGYSSKSTNGARD